MKKVIGEALKVPAHRLLSHEPLTAYGLDSILVVRLTNALKDVFGSVSSTLFLNIKPLMSLLITFCLPVKKRSSGNSGMDGLILKTPNGCRLPQKAPRRFQT